MWSRSGGSLREFENKRVGMERNDLPKTVYIPEASVYDEQPSLVPPRDSAILQKAVTVFGYSPANLECVLRQFRDLGEIKEISYGKNWMDIKYEKEKCMLHALQMSSQIINGEMIGVAQKARNNMGIGRVEKSSLFIKQDHGLLGRIFTYLFG
ncbi:hypothetical protein NEPAR06_1263 [Nematocida parisii]|uniref:RRM Nup35-type domain-containing protein n=1 Tax=Nematocida parisii (strain ERTm3) TaxID=935791 RepID=I3EHQ0_NEMP3|nr:uncharacterized protein NEPG_00528 [Nematocida parisii ERTm1]EIJ88747.1 hypothetical protein NEQG_01437 [Nematocida parisii ERTm3]KAI5131189.1 hypothetical protein NEPAR08_2373 [Nematocida parisii]EIJ95003.1 hypothetical protein NEPG_00528 [Nematocida parisii ERTm1]KAI5131243.1 hypothetical protein NEPAR03_2355 [Nematocida parisii]KAI5140780.1 hypothetical protein NEPAR04_0497 [Nematocida parisii]|eukprot:XP_013058359.1 hypothetical protein NEPG_00528 [Nematocida parisii ERTm1]